MFRTLEARQQRQHWFRDHLREDAEHFLTDGQQFLDIVWKKLVGDLDDASEAIRGPTAALEVHLSRLQLVAERPVSEAAADVFKKLKSAFDAGQMAKSPLDGGRWDAAQAAAETAARAMTTFADLVRRDLS